MYHISYVYVMGEVFRPLDGLMKNVTFSR